MASLRGGDGVSDQFALVAVEGGELGGYCMLGSVCVQAAGAAGG